MDQILYEIADSSGFLAMLIVLGALVKYILTIVFLCYGIDAFRRYISKN